MVSIRYYLKNMIFAAHTRFLSLFQSTLPLYVNYVYICEHVKYINHKIKSYIMNIFLP